MAQAGTALLAPSILPRALLVGLFSSALPFRRETVALTRMPARVYGTPTCLEPALGALMGFLFLHESLTEPQLTGIAAVIAAAFGAALTSRPPVPSPEQIFHRPQLPGEPGRPGEVERCRFTHACEYFRSSASQIDEAGRILV